MLHRLGDLMYRRARLVLLVTGILLAAAAVIGVGAFGKLQGGGFDDPHSASTKAADQINARFGGEDNLILLVRAQHGTVDSADVQSAGLQLTDSLAARTVTIDRVTSYWTTPAPALRSKDGTQAMVLLHVKGSDQQVTDGAKSLIATYAAPGAGIGSSAISVLAGGDAAINVQVNAQVGKSLALAEGIAVPLILILLIFAFGSVVSALLPLAIGGIAILATFAELFILGSVTNVSIYAISLTTQLGLGLGIDYALLMVSRFREQLAAGQDVRDAVVHTTATAGRTVLFSATTVAVALTALLIFPQFFLKSFAFAGIGVALIAAVSTVVVIPALLALLGHRVNAGRLRWAASGRGDASPLWGRIARGVTRRPVLAAVPVLAVLLVAASPLLGVTFGTPDQTVLRPGMSSRQVSEAVSADFSGDTATTVNVVTAGPVASTAANADYARQLSTLPGVVRVDSSVGTFAAGRSAPGDPGNAALGNAAAQRYTVVIAPDPTSSAAQQLVGDIRALPGPDHVGTLVGGRTAALVDAKSSIGSHLPWALLIVVIATFLLLFLFTGSVIQPLRALVVNGLSLSAALGVMTWVFQDGHLTSLLAATPRPMDTSMTVLALCLAFGLSMDYEAFLTSRIKEMHDQGTDTTTAVVHGLARTGRIVSTAAGLLAVTFFAFGTSSVSFLQMLGLGAGLAVLLDATLIRGVLVPSVTALAGERIWYAPSWLRAAHRRIGLSEGPVTEQPDSRYSQLAHADNG
ncbi:MMPL family transporter [Actinocrinis sp.]|uniref:MMPL family transporter n=1 Tax=Actinocrinis sp. TaxID=1920516 RepID=UPI002D5A1366|nr:MMPL family transporter [Actinocrinis sp.]HZP50373.1 MMPL family transporter [Actinocrinis sp.]